MESLVYRLIRRWIVDRICINSNQLLTIGNVLPVGRALIGFQKKISPCAIDDVLNNTGLLTYACGNTICGNLQVGYCLLIRRYTACVGEDFLFIDLKPGIVHNFHCRRIGCSDNRLHIKERSSTIKFEDDMFHPLCRGNRCARVDMLGFRCNNRRDFAGCFVGLIVLIDDDVAQNKVGRNIYLNGSADK